MDNSRKLHFLNLPVVMIEHIFSYLSFDEIAKNRLVCKEFDLICQRLLNRGFLMTERRHNLSLKSVKAQLPRRESERRYHPLSRHCDILTSIETRISMLNMTYSKFIDNNICCFIPGKVIDEIQRVLNTVEKSHQPLRAHEVLQELRDISSMAIEHFDDKVSPAFRKKLQEGVAAKAAHESGLVSRQSPEPTHPSLWVKEFMTLRKRVAFNSKFVNHVTYKYNRVIKKMQSYKKLLVQQNRLIREMNIKQLEQDTNIADLKKRIEECDIKYSELTHTNVGGKAVTAPKSDPTPLRNFSSQIKLDLSVLPIGTGRRNSGYGVPNIKPRKALVRLPSLSESEEEISVSSRDGPLNLTQQPRKDICQQNLDRRQSNFDSYHPNCDTHQTGNFLTNRMPFLQRYLEEKAGSSSRVSKRSINETSPIDGFDYGSIFRKKPKTE